MEAVEETAAPVPARRWGAVLVISVVTVGAVVIGPRLVAAQTTETVRAEGTVICAVSPVVEFSEKLTNSGAADQPFKANLLAGTMACADNRTGMDKKIIGAAYRKESFDAKGNCASFSLAQAEVTVDWLVLGAEPERGKVMLSDLDGSGTNPPKVTIDGGPLKGWMVDVEVNDLTAAMAAMFKEACDAGKEIDKTGTSMNLVFTSTVEPPSAEPPTGVVPPASR